MGMSIHLSTIVPVDEKYEKMLKVYESCKEAGLDIPEEVDQFFDYQESNPDGIERELNKDFIDKPYKEGYDIYEVDIEELLRCMPDVKYLRFMISY